MFCARKLGANFVMTWYDNQCFKNMFNPNFLGATVFGLGWAMTGACPGPLYAFIGSGTTIMVLAVVAGIIGVYVYAALRDRLPH